MATQPPWDSIMAKVKLSHGYLPSKDWDRIQSSVQFGADSLWEGASVGLGGKSPENVLKALCIMANITNPDEKTSSATKGTTVDDIISSAVKKASRNAKARATTAYLASLWGNKKRGLECKGGAFSDPMLTASYIVTTDNEVMLLSMAVDWIKKQQSGYNHMAWAIIEYSKLFIDDAKVLQYITSDLLLSNMQKKNTFIDSAGQKLPASEPWLLLNAPASSGTLYSEQQEHQCWVFSVSKLPEMNAKNTLIFSKRILSQITIYAQQDYLYYVSTPGYGLSVCFVESVLSRVLTNLTTLAVSHTELFSDIEGEVMGLFFQLLPQGRRHTATSVLPRGLVKVTGSTWLSDDALTKTAVAATQTARRSTAVSKGVPAALLSAHYPAEIYLESSTDYLTTVDIGSSPASVPLWKGEIFLSIVTFFCSTNSLTESTVIDEFFASPHWNYYHQMSHTFVPSLYKFLRRFGSRPSMNNQLPGLHSRLLLLASWAPHSHVQDFINIIPLLVKKGSSKYWYDMLYRIIDLPLLSHVVAKHGSEATKVNQSVGGTLLSSLCSVLLTPISADETDKHETATSIFWSNHKNNYEQWIAEVENFPIGRKGVTMAKYLPKILHKFLSAVSTEAKNDPCVIAGLVSIILRRYHMLALPLQCAKEVRVYILQEATKLAISSPHVFHLVFEDLVAAVRQQYFKNPQYRCTLLTMKSALLASELVSRIIKPQFVPNPTPLEEVQSLFDQIVGSLNDVLVKLQARLEIGNSEHTQFSMFSGGVKLHIDVSRKRSSMGKSKVTGNRYLHDNLKVVYTVADAVECVDSLLTSLVSISISNPTLVPKSISACLVASRCVSQGVLPGSLSPTISRLLSWLKSPTTTLLAVHQPCPLQHSSNQSGQGNSNSVQMLLPRRANRVPELG